MRKLACALRRGSLLPRPRNREPLLTATRWARGRVARVAPRAGLGEVGFKANHEDAETRRNTDMECPRQVISILVRRSPRRYDCGFYNLEHLILLLDEWNRRPRAAAATMIILICAGWVPQDNGSVGSCLTLSARVLVSHTAWCFRGFSLRSRGPQPSVSFILVKD